MDKINRLNSMTVKALKSREKRYTVGVISHPGLLLRVGVKGDIVFTYRYQLAGQRRSMALGSYPSKKLTELETEYSKARQEVKNGIDPLEVKETETAAENPTVLQLVIRYLENYVDVKLKLRTQKEYRRQFEKYILPKLGKRKVNEVKRATIVALVEYQAKKNGPIMANRNLAVIKGLFTYAVKVGILEHSPAAGISPPGKPVVKDRVLSLKEVSLMIKVLNDAPRDARDILLLILLTGQRPGEICAMHRSQLEGEWWNLAGSDTKSGRAHRVYLSKWVRDIIKARQDDGLSDDYLFPSYGEKRLHLQPDNLKNWFNRKLNQEFQNVGIQPFTAHDLRRTAATGMAKLGHAAVVPDILNHAPQGITRTVYDRYDREPEIKRALIIWEHAIKQAVEGDSEGIVVEVDFQ